MIGASPRDISQLQNLTQLQAPTPPARFKVLKLLDACSYPKPTFWWDAYIPAGVVTLLGAHGGTGKSTIALMLGVHIALGLPMFEIATKKGRVAYYSGEDPESVLMPRLAKICDELGLPPVALCNDLHLLDAASFDPTLYQDGTGRGEPVTVTETYAALAQFIETYSIDVLIVDNASDAYAASEIDRAKVRGFIRSLQQIISTRGGAVLLLAHVDKGTSREGKPQNSEGYSGSTAWHNSVRSRVFMYRATDGQLVIQHQKSNLGTMRGPLRLDWNEDELPKLGAARPEGNPAQPLVDQLSLNLILPILRRLHSRGDFISTADNSRNNAHAMLSAEEDFPKGLTKKDLERILRLAQDQKQVERECYKTHDYKRKERWAPIDVLTLPPSPRSPPTVELGGEDEDGGPQATERPPSPPSSLGGYGGEREEKDSGGLGVIDSMSTTTMGENRVTPDDLDANAVPAAVDTNDKDAKRETD